MYCVVFFSLADLASFVHHIKDNYSISDQAQWICFGGSYPGALSAWFRLKVSLKSIRNQEGIYENIFGQHLGLFAKTSDFLHANNEGPSQQPAHLHSLILDQHLCYSLISIIFKIASL